MKLSRNKLYILLAVSCVTGYAWLFSANNAFVESNFSNAGVCLVKHVTGIPCPSCGSTRSILSLLDGNLADALYWNPVGIVLLLILIIVPIWIFYDCFIRKDTLYNFYKKAEISLQQKKVAIPAILLMLVNWIWNIYKGL
jgi:hypothetical protein